jgi:hypothetical protein
MRRGSAAAVSKEVEDLRQRLEHWRSTHKRRGRLPEALWVILGRNSIALPGMYVAGFSFCTREGGMSRESPRVAR